jgi:leader peptidase (prepilin peptidase)/N-methyltransferase
MDPTLAANAGLILAWTTLYAFCWGAVWGSFYNVVIWRMPRGANLANPPSHCPSCSAPIRWYDNVPIFAWLWLRGRCRDCHAPISVRYPAVELLVAVLSAALWWQIAHASIGYVPLGLLAARWLLGFVYVSLLVCIAFIDLDLQIIPHRLSFPAMALGVALAVLQHHGPLVPVVTFPAPAALESLLGLAIGGGFIVALFFAYRWYTGFEGIGLGDATLLAAIGANVGAIGLVPILMFASFQGVIAALVLSWLEKRGTRSQMLLQGAHREEYWDPETGLPRHAVEDGAAELPDEGFLKRGVPFGPFLVLAALEYVFVGYDFLYWLSSGLYP